MAQIEKEAVITSYHGRLYSRLFGYMKPYLGRFMLAVAMMLMVTVFSLVKPLLIARAIDTYIEGYSGIYAVVSAEEGEIAYDGMYLTKNDSASEASAYAILLLHDDRYYFYGGLSREQAETLHEYAAEGLPIAAADEAQMTLNMEDGSQLSGACLDADALKLLRSTDYKGVLTIGLIYAVLVIVQTVMNALQRYILLCTGQDIIYNVRNEVFRHIHTLPLRFFDTHAAGQIDTRVTNDVESLNRMYSMVLVNLICNAVTIIGYVVVMLRLSVRLALVSFVALPIVFALTWIFRIISRRIYRVVRTKVSQLNIFLSEHISGMKLIQIFAREKEKFAEFTQRSDDLFRSRMRELTASAIFRPLTNFVANLALAAIIWYGAHSVLAGVLTVGVLYVFTSYIRSIFDPIQELAEQFSTLQSALAAAEKIFTLLDEKNTIEEKPQPTRLGTVRGKIEFKHVWFAYDGEEFVLRDVSFVIHPGEKVAFVGATGAGKSSILNLIARYYDIQKGQILIDDVDIRDLSLEELRHAIGQMQQSVHIFTGDVKTNIRLLNDEISMEQVRAAAKAVNADGFIEKLPNGYDEPLTEGGTNLSFGQRQLISFARTLVIDPAILVMDEATANIDTETETLIQDALKTMMEGRTTIMVAHRLSTIQHADNIIVMHHGRIRESGTHQELLARNGIYRKLYDLQLYSEN